MSPIKDHQSVVYSVGGGTLSLPTSTDITEMRYVIRRKNLFALNLIEHKVTTMH